MLVSRVVVVCCELGLKTIVVALLEAVNVTSNGTSIHSSQDDAVSIILPDVSQHK